MATATTRITDSSGGSTASSTIAAAVNLDTLTDSSGGAASTTLASISDTATKNAVASIAAELALQKTLNALLIDAVAKITLRVNALLVASPNLSYN